MLSLEKVEKVVRLPQKPVTRKRAVLDLSKLNCISQAVSIPIKKQPSILAAKVAQGKPLALAGVIMDSVYRRQAPRPPPINTQINCLPIILFDGQ